MAALLLGTLVTGSPAKEEVYEWRGVKLSVDPIGQVVAFSRPGMDAWVEAESGGTPMRLSEVYGKIGAAAL